MERLCRAFDAWEAVDSSPFQRRARLLQSIWRSEKGFPMGSLKGTPRGAMLQMPFAEEYLANFLTPRIQGLVRNEVMDPDRARGKLYGKPRIFNNLLSSQPLCFNLFGELAFELDLATAVFSELSGGRIARVEHIDFEYSPGRGDPR